ncbi:hypothetical protein AXF42_Ash007092 [Apostasia shenzhenica]|uniref:Uncharacterized protein n=1 Tax=Apostasia shenzhenica TaxID=1088818 RepID=A0A2I0BF11_9ASPA|nr:hypothetical protein AXF42_Ash007092 [Apostasia shenzhenica]
MAKTQPPPSPGSSDSSDGEESPPPATAPSEKPSAGSNAVDRRMPAEPSSDSTDGEEDHSSDSEESSEDSPAVTAKNDPPVPQPASQSAGLKQTSNPASSSESSSEEGDDSEGEDSSSESDRPPLAPPKETGSVGGHKKEIPTSVVAEDDDEDGDADDDDDEEDESSSESEQTAHPPRGSLLNPADPTLKPISSKPMDSPARPLEKGPINGKRPAPPTIPSPEMKKKKAAAGDGAEGQQQQQEMPKRTRNVEEEFMLHSGIQHHKERENIVLSKCSEEYPFLHGFLMRGHASKSPLLLLSGIYKAKARELDEKCEKLVIAEVQLNKQKHNVLADALQLITYALAERQ